MKLWYIWTPIFIGCFFVKIFSQNDLNVLAYSLESLALEKRLTTKEAEQAIINFFSDKNKIYTEKDLKDLKKYFEYDINFNQQPLTFKFKSLEDTNAKVVEFQAPWWVIIDMLEENINLHEVIKKIIPTLTVNSINQYFIIKNDVGEVINKTTLLFDIAVNFPGLFANRKETIKLLLEQGADATMDNIHPKFRHFKTLRGALEKLKKEEQKNLERLKKPEAQATDEYIKEAQKDIDDIQEIINFLP